MGHTTTRPVAALCGEGTYTSGIDQKKKSEKKRKKKKELVLTTE
jgi:hypothetical protein